MTKSAIKQLIRENQGEVLWLDSSSWGIERSGVRPQTFENVEDELAWEDGLLIARCEESPGEGLLEALAELCGMEVRWA